MHGPIGVVPLALLSRRISSPAVLIAKISLFPLQKQNKQQLMIIREEKDALVCFNYNKRQHIHKYVIRLDCSAPAPLELRVSEWVVGK